MKNKIFIVILIFIAFPFSYTKADLKIDQADPKIIDTDNDGLKDFEETDIYHTNPTVADTDNDGFSDGDEVKYLFDPNKSGDDRLSQSIKVSIKDQALSYYLGDYKINTFKISSGDRKHPTPKGEYKILAKRPLVTYKGSNYYYPNTRWNMMFKRGGAGNLYIHGAYWHDNFGKPFSHGCVNVAYKDIEALYNWAQVGTKVVIE